MEDKTLQVKDIEAYIQEVFGENAKISSVSRLGELDTSEDELKGFGYGKPYLVRFTVDGDGRSAVISSVMPGSFGHEHKADRAQILLWQHDTFNRLPGHAHSLDVGYLTQDGRMKSAGDAEEYFILMEEVHGSEYFLDLERIKEKGAQELDEQRVVAMASYLADIHSQRKEDENLYFRRVRELLGHGECIMGLTDSYPKGLDFISWGELCDIERRCVDWRWKLKEYAHRLCVVHGDFHPWNVMFHDHADANFTVLDRSRGEFGEAADDVSSMTINCVLYSLQKHGLLEGDFKDLFELFFRTYLDLTGDEELLKVIQPFYAFRGLVVASPIWYPNLGPDIRSKLFNFIHNVLNSEKFDPEKVNYYLTTDRR